MDNLRQFKIDLKQALPQKGVAYVLKTLREALPDSSPACNLVVQLESEYREHKLQIIEGILDQDEIQKAANLIRKRLLDLIDSLKEEDFSAETPASLHEADQRVRRGHVLYQIPKKMQLGRESRCLIRIAFDKTMLLEDLDMDADTEVRSNLRISDYMKVELVDPAASGVFAIRSQSEAVQFIDKDDFTEWRFYVKPLQAGEYTLELKVTIIMVINGREVPRERTLEESVVIIAEPVEEPPAAFRSLGDAFEIGAGLEIGEPPATEAETLPPGAPTAVEERPLPPPPPAPAPSQGGGIAQKRDVVMDPPMPYAPSRRDSGVRLPRSLRTAAFALLTLIVASSAAYAFTPPAELAWVSTRYLKNTPEAYDAFIAQYGEKSPLRREQAFFRKAVVSGEPDAYRTYLAEYDRGRFAEEAGWGFARLSDDPDAYERYIRQFPQGKQLAEAQKALQRLEPKIWETAVEKNDLAALDRYLELFPEGQFRQEALLRKQHWDERERIQVETQQITVPESIRLSDDEVWENIRQSSRAEDLRKYLELFPEGKHEREARRRLSVIEIDRRHKTIDSGEGQKKEDLNYQSIELGGQTWLAENLQLEVGNSWCYKNNPENCKKYGRLYTWEAAKNACQALGAGWHLPTESEWNKLRMTFGASANAFKALEKGGESNFNVLLGGNRLSNGDFSSLGIEGAYWTATEDNVSFAKYYSFMGLDRNIYPLREAKSLAFSVRCLKD